ncbi:MAPEG family protein [Ponticoccus litoralis]|uniref:MAPEG family protein n=1 Tax=Ponticoccus litoralis TaxID=422297 RepID=A0AAW9SSV5_9RHOB
MTPELTILTLAALWQVVHFALYSVTAQRQVGPKYAASPRDTPRQLTGIAGRAQRAMTNHFEGLILFAIATLTLTYADKTGDTTAMLAALYLAARLLYLPAYLLGWTPWRSLIWAPGFGATVALLILALI